MFFQIFNLMLLFYLMFGNPTIGAQPFEGKINCVKETLTDTVHYTYYIKNSMVRIDEYDKNDVLINYTLIDLEKQTMRAVNPSRKLYMSIPVHPYESPADEFRIIKTKNYKMINKYKCYQWRVRNEKNNTEIAYWVAKDDFHFFEKLLRIINRQEKHPKYYLQISDTNGFFPMLSVERSLLREFRTRIMVVDIEKSQLPDSLFSIPGDYKPFEYNSHANSN